jgi:hypothetical protein
MSLLLQAILLDSTTLPTVTRIDFLYFSLVPINSHFVRNKLSLAAPRMPPKKKAGVSKTDIKPEPIPDEKQPADSSGYTLTGNIEVDFPEYLRALGVSHPPIVVMHKTNSGEEKTAEDIQDAVHELITVRT